MTLQMPSISPFQTPCEEDFVSLPESEAEIYPDAPKSAYSFTAKARFSTQDSLTMPLLEKGASAQKELSGVENKVIVSAKPVLQPRAPSPFAAHRESLATTNPFKLPQEKRETQLATTVSVQSPKSAEVKQHRNELAAQQRETRRLSQENRNGCERKNEKNETQGVRQWKTEETVTWWDKRLSTQRDREGKNQQEEQEEHDEQPTAPQTNTKPVLEKSRLGIFALYYVLTKIGLYSEGASSYHNKKEMETLDIEMTALRKQQIEEMKKAIAKERSSQRWGIAAKVFSWIAASASIATGAILFLSGVGTVMGAVLIVAGIAQLTNQIMEFTGAWGKIAEALPGEDPEKKRAVVMWMQIAIGAISLLLAGISIIGGGYGNLGEAMGIAQSMINAVALTARGTCEIGNGITTSQHKDKLANLISFEKRVEQLRHHRRDLTEIAEWGIEHLQQLFEDIVQALQFEVDLFRADQKVIMR